MKIHDSFFFLIEYFINQQSHRSRLDNVPQGAHIWIAVLGEELVWKLETTSPESLSTFYTNAFGPSRPQTNSSPTNLAPNQLGPKPTQQQANSSPSQLVPMPTWPQAKSPPSQLGPKMKNRVIFSELKIMEKFRDICHTGSTSSEGLIYVGNSSVK